MSPEEFRQLVLSNPPILLARFFELTADAPFWENMLPEPPAIYSDEMGS